jgi:YidC/Oxa1 family membrane protein insertase
MGSLWEGLQNLLGSVLSFFYDLIPNLGVAIILLTIAVGVVMFPLTLKQTRSMKAMQEIQPEIKRLQKQYKGDKQTLQEKTMALYREKGVNPAAGCLPLLLQMPIWFALFRVLRQFATDDPTRFVPSGSALAEAAGPGHALTFLWMDMRATPSEAFQSGFLTALPYLITIFIVMGTAYWQQRQTMARSKKDGQEEQKQPGQAVMKIFPIFFGFISFTLPAGLVVYFAASQIFRIGQQALILRMDARKGEESGSKSLKEKSSKDEPAPEKKKTDEKPERKPDRGKSAGPSSRPSAQRRPQGSKKKRGKKRRRR